MCVGHVSLCRTMVSLMRDANPLGRLHGLNPQFVSLSNVFASRTVVGCFKCSNRCHQSTELACGKSDVFDSFCFLWHGGLELSLLGPTVGSLLVAEAAVFLGVINANNDMPQR